MTHFIEQLELQARERPNAVAISWGSERWCYAKLVGEMYTVARAAVAKGYQPGQRFLYAAKPTPRSIAFALGLLRAGLTLVFVDPFSAPNLFAARAELVKPALTVADSILYLAGHQRLRWLRRALRLTVCDYAAAPGQHIYIGRWLPGLPKGATNAATWEQSAYNPGLQPLDADADLITVFTSGTTGSPKGVVHSLATLSANAQAFADLLDVKPGQVIFTEPMTVGMLALTRGAEWVLPRKGAELPANIDVLFAVPTDVRTLMRQLSQLPEEERPQIAQLATGGAPVLPSLVRLIDATLGPDTKVWSVYGMTEMLPIAACDARLKAAHEHGDWIGPTVGDVQVKLAEDSELLVRGPGLMKFYMGQPVPEWHATGDLARIETDRSITLLGRKKNMLIRGNKNIYPSLYEPGITAIGGVAAAHIVGVPDEIGDDRVVLVIGAEPDVTDFEALKRKVLAALPKVVDADAMPEAVEVLAEIPVSGRANKPDIDALRRVAADVLGVAE